MSNRGQLEYFIQKYDVSPGMCYMLRLECGNQADRRLISLLKEVADKQRESFPDITPWDMRCKRENKDVVMYVAITRNKSLRTRGDSITYSKIADEVNDISICGWMSVNVENNEHGKQYYLNQVAARNDPMQPKKGKKLNFYAGIGTAFIQMLEEDAKQNGVNYIYLLSLSSAVGFYKKMGYSRVTEPSGMYMYKQISAIPNYFIMKLRQKEDDNRKRDAIMEALTNIQIELMAIDESDAAERMVDLKPEQEMELLRIWQQSGNANISKIIRWIEDATDQEGGGKRKGTKPKQKKENSEKKPLVRGSTKPKKVS